MVEKSHITDATPSARVDFLVELEEMWSTKDTTVTVVIVAGNYVNMFMCI